MTKRSLSDFNVDSEQPTKKSFLDYGLAAAPDGIFSFPDELSPTEPSERFNFVTESDVKALSTAIPPKTTISSTTWAVRNFNEWLKSRNERYPHNRVPENLLGEGNAEELNHWLSYYVNETRNCKGDLYPPKTLYLILSGLLRHARSLNTNAPNFLDKSIPVFKPLHAVLDNLFKSLRKEGIGCNSRHAEIITKEEESMLWESNVMNLRHPRGLLRAVFYYNGKNFCLRGGAEHRNLKLSQFTKFSDHYIYTENASKNRQGGLARKTKRYLFIPVLMQVNDVMSTYLTCT